MLLIPAPAASITAAAFACVKDLPAGCAQFLLDPGGGCEERLVRKQQQLSSLNGRAMLPM
jgi:hypothetical protein